MTAVTLTSFQINGEQPFYTTYSDLGRYVHRKVCGDCGLPITFIAEFAPNLFVLKGGVLDASAWLNPEFECYTDNGLFRAPISDLQQFPKMPNMS